MAFYHSHAVDGNGGIYSLTQDPLKPVEQGVAPTNNVSGPGQAGIQNGSNRATAVTAGTVLRIIRGGEGYSAATNVVTNTTTAALNTWSGQEAKGSALTTVRVDTTVQDGRIVRAVVNTGAADSVGYHSGDWVSVNGNTAGLDDCILEISEEL